MGHSKDKKEWIVLDRLADLILRGVDGCVVDIGIGLSTLILSKHAKALNRRHYTCDISQRAVDHFLPSGSERSDHIIMVCDAMDFIKSFHDPPALVFIDGKHEYNQVLVQVEYFLEIMPFGSVLFVHDTCPPKKFIRLDGTKCGDVYRIRKFLETRKDIHTFTWPYKFQAQGCGLTMVMKWEGIL